MPLTQQALDAIGEFKSRPDISPRHVRRLEEAINASPILVEAVNAAVADGGLVRFSPASRHWRERAYCSATGELGVPVGFFRGAPHGDFDASPAIVFLANELCFAGHRERLEDAIDKMGHDGALVCIQSYDSPATHDYTDVIREYISTTQCLGIEGKVGLAGWNALVDAAWEESTKEQGERPTLKDIYQRLPGDMTDLVEVDHSTSPPTYSMKYGLRIRRDLHMEESPHEVAVMANNYFNKNRVNIYGAEAIGAILDLELEEYEVNRIAPGEEAFWKHEIRIDLTELGLCPRLLAAHGMDIEGCASPFYCLDKSSDPPAYVLLSDTVHGPAHRIDQPSLEHQFHPGYALYANALACINGLSVDLPAENHRNMSAFLAVSARTNNMTSIDRVVIDGDQVVGIQGEGPRMKSAPVSMSLAAGRSFEQSSKEWLSAHVSNPPLLESSSQPGHSPRPNQAGPCLSR